ncbi:MAG: flagellar biosynthetic protein FliO [Spirochaetia bacterium]|jgi:flagellar biogenesis protein FliO|nr:flagellar biosynthetic protein FliO [Spirochaetia bacterium]
MLMLLLCIPLFALPSLGVPKEGQRKTAAEPAGKKAAAAEPAAAGIDGQSAEGALPSLPAAEYTEDDFRPKTTGDSYAWDIIKLIIILGLMVGGFYYFFKFVTKKTGINVRGADVIQTLAVSPVGANKYIQVVDIAGKVLVIGIADGGINLITEITNKDDIDRVRLAASSAAPLSAGGFQDYLKERIGSGIGKVVEKINKRKPDSTPYNSAYTDESLDLDYLKKQNGRLKNLHRYGDE